MVIFDLNIDLNYTKIGGWLRYDFKRIGKSIPRRPKKGLQYAKDKWNSK